MNDDHSQRYTVREASELLGITPEAVRARLFRGTLQRETGDDGTVFVVLHAPPRSDQSSDQSSAQALIVERLDSQLEDMREQVAFLRHELDQRTEEIRRRDTIIAQLTQRIPELTSGSSSEASGPPEASEYPLTAAEPSEATGPQTPQKRETPAETPPWWRRMFGG